jgi:uncharacterized protein (TIGR02246 family)
MKRRRMQLAFALGLLSLGLPRCLAAQTQADTASVQAFYREWFGSIQQGPDRYASFYAPDGQLLPPNAPPVRGRTAIAEWFRKSQSDTPYTVRPEGIVIDEIRFLAADWVVYRSTLRGQRVPKAGGDATPFVTKYFDVLQRNAEGRWQVVYRMWSDNL